MKAPRRTGERDQTRRDLMRQYMRLQRELIEGDPSSSAYQTSIHAFRQMGYTLISSGYEEDLDRLLRIRVLDGGRAARSPREQRALPSDLHVIESRPAKPDRFRYPDRSSIS